MAGDTKTQGAEQLANLFKARLKSYKSYTNKIRKLIDPGLDHVELYMRENLLQPGCKVEWGAITQVPGDSMLIVTVKVSWPPGHTVRLDSGQTAVITPATAHYFQYTIHVGMPYQLFFDTATAIADYMRATEDDEQRAFKKAIGEAFGPIVPTEFDVDSLTEEQQKALSQAIDSNEQNSRH